MFCPRQLLFRRFSLLFFKNAFTFSFSIVTRVYFAVPVTGSRAVELAGKST